MTMMIRDIRLSELMDGEVSEEDSDERNLQDLNEVYIKRNMNIR